MNTLNACIRAFLVGDIDYREFRRHCGRYVDSQESHLHGLTESACSAFEHAIINEPGLRRELLDSLLVKCSIQSTWPTATNANIAVVSWS